MHICYSRQILFFLDQIPKRGLLYIRGIPKHISEEKLANSLKAIEAIIPKNLMDKRIGWVFPVQGSKSCQKSTDLGIVQYGK